VVSPRLHIRGVCRTRPLVYPRPDRGARGGDGERAVDGPPARVVSRAGAREGRRRVRRAPARGPRRAARRRAGPHIINSHRTGGVTRRARSVRLREARGHGDARDDHRDDHPGARTGEALRVREPWRSRPRPARPALAGTRTPHTVHESA
jgi:hypothetical protein